MFESQYLVIDPAHQGVHERLQEWRRWVSGELGGAQRCRSIEGFYQAPRPHRGIVICDECGYPTRIAFSSDCGRCGTALPPAEVEQDTPPPAVEVLRAFKTECTVIALPRKYRLHLQFWYVHRLTMKAARRRLAVPEQQLTTHLWTARQMVRNVLDRTALFAVSSGATGQPSDAPYRSSGAERWAAQA